MELRDIEYFAVIAQHKSIGRAAEALDMSQPALSKSLRRLEKAIRAKVVQRTSTGIELTAIGHALLAKVSRLRLTMDDISREAADLSEGRAGHLSIGTPPAFAPHIVPMACETLLKEAPLVTLKLTVSERVPLLAGLRNGTLDIALTLMQITSTEDLIEQHLYDEEYVVYASVNHRLAKQKQVSLADLVQERWAMSDINNPSWLRLNEVFAKASLPSPKIGLQAPYMALRQRLVSASDLLSHGSREIVRCGAAHFPIVALNVKNFSTRRKVGVLYRNEAYLPPVGLRFIEILKATAKKISNEAR